MLTRPGDNRLFGRQCFHDVCCHCNRTGKRLHLSLWSFLLCLASFVACCYWSCGFALTLSVCPSVPSSD